MKILGHFRNRLSAVIHDLLMIPAAWLGAYWLRFSLGEISDPFLSSALVAMPLVVVIQGAFFWYFGLYRGVWRFASLPDLVRIVKAVAMGVAQDRAGHGEGVEVSRYSGGLVCRRFSVHCEFRGRR